MLATWGLQLRPTPYSHHSSLLHTLTWWTGMCALVVHVLTGGWFVWKTMFIEFVWNFGRRQSHSICKCCWKLTSFEQHPWGGSFFQNPALFSWTIRYHLHMGNSSRRRHISAFSIGSSILWCYPLVTESKWDAILTEMCHRNWTGISWEQKQNLAENFRNFSKISSGEVKTVPGV